MTGTGFDREWRRVVRKDEIQFRALGEPVPCPVCRGDFLECLCPGEGDHDAYEYEERDGVLHARRRG